METLVYASLLLMVMSGIFGVFIAAMRSFHASRTSIEVQQEALNATYRLCLDLSESNPASVTFARYAQTLAQGGVIWVNAISFMSPRDTTGQISFCTTSSKEGHLRWQSYICYYTQADPDDPERFLLRRKVIPATASDTPTPCPTSLADLRAAGGGQLVARRLSRFVLLPNTSEITAATFTGPTSTPTPFIYYYGPTSLTSMATTPAAITISIRVSQVNSQGKLETISITDTANMMGN